MSAGVLIADSDAERGRRVAVACSAYGIQAQVVAHGAAALEQALGAPPAALVAQIELPLIDGVRLAEILQANPRTRGLGILFVGDGVASAPPAGARRASVIPGHAEPDTIARFIQALLQKRRSEPVPTGGDAAPAVEGQLGQISLAELIELLHVNRNSGVIELRQGDARRALTGRVELRDGDVIQARCGGVEGEKALFRLLAWRRGQFAFREGRLSERAAIERPTRALVREGQRQADEWARIGAELPSPHAGVALKVAPSSLPNVLHPLTQEVLLVLEVSDTVQDVLDRASYPDYQVLRTLQTLVRHGLVALREDAARADASAAGPFAPAQAARLRDWLDQARPRDAAPIDAKVLVVASGADAQRAFRACIAEQPRVERTPGGRSRDAADADAAPVVRTALRVPLDDEVGLELVEVPAAGHFAPIWPLAAHGALATLFVHAGPLDASCDALRAAIEEVTALPRARALHVLLDAPADAAERLCRRLGLLDDRSVLALSSDPARAGDEVRELWLRLLP